MRESEVQSPITNILRRREVMSLLLRGHSIPDAVTLLVAPDVVKFRAGVQNYQVDATDSNEDPVAVPVPGSIALDVDVRCDDRAELHKHVVEGCVDSPARHGARVTRAPAYLYRMRIRIRQERRRQALSTPDNMSLENVNRRRTRT